MEKQIPSNGYNLPDSLQELILDNRKKNKRPNRRGKAGKKAAEERTSNATRSFERGAKMPKLMDECSFISQNSIVVGIHFEPGISIISPLILRMPVSKLGYFNLICNVFESAVISRYIEDLKELPLHVQQFGPQTLSFWNDLNLTTSLTNMAITAHGQFQSSNAGMMIVQRPAPLVMRTIIERISKVVPKSDPPESEVSPAGSSERTATVSSSQFRRLKVHVGKYLAITADFRLILFLLYKLRQLRAGANEAINLVVMTRIKLIIPRLPQRFSLDYNNILEALHVVFDAKENALFQSFLTEIRLTDETDNACLLNPSLALTYTEVYGLYLKVKGWLATTNVNYKDLVSEMKDPSVLCLPVQFIEEEMYLNHCIYLDDFGWRTAERISGILLPPYQPNVCGASSYNLVFDSYVVNGNLTAQDLSDVGYGSVKTCRRIDGSRQDLIRDLMARLE